MDNKVFLMEHPLIQHKISMLRDRKTGSKEFRELVREISMLMSYEVTRYLPLKKVEIETPVAFSETKVISGKKIAVVAILRAGIGMTDGILQLIPAAKVGHIGVYRDPDELKPVKYYCKLPSDIEHRDVFLLDPMLATGGSAIHSINLLKDKGVKTIKFICIIASKPGIKALTEAYPEVDIYCGAIDDSLNEKGYIVPGLGDAGDRIFGTK